MTGILSHNYEERKKFEIHWHCPPKYIKYGGDVYEYMGFNEDTKIHHYKLLTTYLLMEHEK